MQRAPGARPRAPTKRSARPSSQSASAPNGHRFGQVPAPGGKGAPKSGDLARRMGLIDNAMKKEKSPAKLKALQQSRLGLQRGRKRLGGDDLDLAPRSTSKMGGPKTPPRI